MSPETDDRDGAFSVDFALEITQAFGVEEGADLLQALKDPEQMRRSAQWLATLTAADLREQFGASESLIRDLRELQFSYI